MRTFDPPTRMGRIWVGSVWVLQMAIPRRLGEGGRRPWVNADAVPWRRGTAG